MAARRLVVPGTGTWIKKDVYPLIAAVSCVISYGIYKSVEHVMTDPDANFNPSRRSTMLRHTEEEGDLVKARIMKNYMHKDDSLAKLSVFNAFSPAYWARRAEVSKDVSHTRQGDGSVRALANAEGAPNEGLKQM